MVCLGVACDDRIPAPDPRPPPTPTPTATPSRSAARKAPRVVIESRGRVKSLLRTAVQDLKAVGIWGRLTGHLYEIELDSRSGVANVPEDGHLADAYFTGVVEPGGAGPVCDVMFFPSAVADDLARWRDYYSAGLMAEPPPSVREFYGSLVAHELAHCRPGARGEAVARAWEARALGLLRDQI